MHLLEQTVTMQTEVCVNYLNCHIHVPSKHVLANREANSHHTYDVTIWLSQTTDNSNIFIRSREVRDNESWLYNLYSFGIRLWTVLYPKPCYNKLCYKEVVVFMFLWKKIKKKNQKKKKKKSKIFGWKNCFIWSYSIFWGFWVFWGWNKNASYLRVSPWGFKVSVPEIPWCGFNRSFN